MKKLKRVLRRTVQQVSDRLTGSGLMQEELSAIGSALFSDDMAALARQAAAEGCVLLKNDGTLPLNKETPVAVFGRCQLDWFYVGYGSGGDVHPPYRVNLMEGLKNAGVPVDEPLAQVYAAWCSHPDHEAYHGWWGHWPMSHPEMPLDQNLVTEAAVRCGTAIVVIGRAAGEDRENTLTPGSYYLTEAERAMLNAITAAFKNTVVVMNTGSIMDMAWTLEYGSKLSAILLAWQGGMESGNGVADVLTGRINPCGRLTDTIARDYVDYPSSRDFGGKAFNNYSEDIFVGYRYFDTFAPERVLYPFGFGLSYTTFTYSAQELAEENGHYTLPVTVTNTGRLPGREVVMLRCSAPQGKLGKAASVLVAFSKTGLLAPNESESLLLTFDDRCLSSFDDTGKAGFPHAFVLEAGEYRFTLNGQDAASLTISKTRCIETCQEVCAVHHSFNRISVREEHGRPIPDCDTVPAGKVNLTQRILNHLPAEIPVTGDRRYKLSDVAAGKITLETFIAQLSDKELEGLTRGEGGMLSSLGVDGNAGVFGGVLPSLREKGIPPVVTADGPSGLRLKRHCALLPIGTALACTWDTALMERLFGELGKEMCAYKLDIVLSPGMNIHRNPLCGRNFEYFSEDPLLTGKMAAAVVRGVQNQGVSCCPKHFACNNQEVRRNTNDSRLSHRALREIYLRGFEIVVKEGHPNTIMTSYNKINGVWAHYNYDLATTILRQEWGFEGVVMTDWWMQRSTSPEFPKIRDNAYRVRAQVDVLMPGNMSHTAKKYRSDGTLLKTLNQPGGITRGELQRTAATVLKLILKTKGDTLTEVSHETI